MLGGGIMANFVSYEALKPNVDIDKYPELNTMDEMEYPFMFQPIVVTNPEPKIEPVTEVKTQETKTTPSQFISERNPNEKSRIDRVVDYALSKAKSKSTHWCARHVRQALESQGFNPGNSINGWEYEKAVKNMGWHEVTDGSIKKGDIIVTKKHDGRGHVALATKDGADIFNDRNSSVSDFVSRGVPYSRDKVKQVNVYRYQFGGHFVSYIPQTIKNTVEKIQKPTVDILKELRRGPVQVVQTTQQQQQKEEPIYYRNYDDFKQSLYEEPKNDAQRAVNFFMKKGLSRESASGLVGNLIRESQLQPNVVNKYSKAYGIAQWLGDRKTKLFAKYGNNPTFEQQLQYVWDELNTTHTRGLQKLKESKTTEEAARNAFGYYEFSVGPEGAVLAMNKYGQDGKKSLNEGIQYANELYNSFKIQKPQQKPLIQEPVSLKIK